MYHNYQHPLYEIEVRSRNCRVELTVNDMPCFKSDEQGGVAVDWPVNPNILSSGRQSFTITSRPYEGGDYIHKSASLSLKVYVRDAFVNDKPRTLVLEMPEVDFSTKSPSQTYVYAGNFDASVPYHQLGWQSSVPLIEEDKERIIKEVGLIYDELLDIFRNRDLSRYLALCHERQEEVFNSFYFKGPLDEKRQSRLIPTLPGVLMKTPYQEYHLSFHGSGKVVGLSLPSKPCGFLFYSSENKTNAVLEMALFHRKSPGAKLTLIR